MKESGFNSALRLMEDALVLVKRADSVSWLVYLGGVVPFFSVLLFDITDLVQNPFAVEHLAAIAFGLTVLYGWLHVCQSVFCARLYGTLTEQDSPLRTQFPAALVSQSVLSGSKLLFWPVTLALLVPHAVVTTFYQHSLLVPEEFATQGWRATIAESKKDAVFQQSQATWMLALIFLLRVLLWINLFVLLFVLPSLWKTFTGVEGNVTRSPGVLINPTSIAAVCILTYLGLDSFVKAACVLRRFARQSETSGRDLRLRLLNVRRNAAAAILLLVLLCFLPRASAARSESAGYEASGTPAERMQRAVDGVFRDPSNTWDLPVVEPRKQTSGGFESFMRWVVDHINRAWQDLNSAVRAFEEWLRLILSKSANANRLKQRPASKSDVSIAIACFSALLVSAALFALWRRARHSRPEPVPAATSAAALNLLEEDVAVADQTGDEWITLAQQYRAAGNFRLALRALYLSSLATLARSGMISPARGKSNLDYSRELQRRAKRVGPNFVTVFRTNVQLFEKSWYGAHPATEETLDSFMRNLSVLQELV